MGQGGQALQVQEVGGGEVEEHLGLGRELIVRVVK